MAQHPAGWRNIPVTLIWPYAGHLSAMVLTPTIA